VSWYRRTASGWLLDIHAQPGAKVSAVAGLHGEALKIRIAAPPVDGKANEALVEFIARQLGIAKRLVCVEKGVSSRDKRLSVAAPAIDPASLLK
jgi:uncharacterized protein (TIGR00251 family)